MYHKLNGEDIAFSGGEMSDILALCAQDCGDCVRVTYDVGGETWAAALKESELALGVGRVAHKI